MEPTVGNGPIIILSDDDDEDCEHEASVVIVDLEDVEKSDSAPSALPLEEDLVITFSRHANVLPHARYDCTIHPFTATDCETDAPVASNQLICDQCFCYVCDKLASTCVMWCHSGMCHCNSHRRSDFWKNLRNTALLGGLKKFDLTLCEIDAHLRFAETTLQEFRRELAAKFSSFLMGNVVQLCNVNASNQKVLIYNYTPVFEFVSSFLNMADRQDERAAAIMRLGVAEDLIQLHTASRPCGTVLLQSPTANAGQAIVMLLQRAISSVQRQMVMSDFTPEFAQKLQAFYKRLYLPAELKNQRNSLSVRRWDDVLLVSVLKGQNVKGTRKDKGKKDVLIEEISVVLLRAEALQRQQRYRELCRYLRVVQTDNSILSQHLKDLVPFFMCLEGDFTSALHTLLPSVSAPASRFTPRLFLFYLCIFKTATAPKLMVSHSVQLCNAEATWETIAGGVPLKREELVKFVLRVQTCCFAVFTDSQCWTSLLALVSKPLPAPSPEFLEEAKAVVRSLLPTQHWSNIQIPRSFQGMYPEQTLLLLVAGALHQRILHSALSPALPVLVKLKENLWAFRWLLDSLSSCRDRLSAFIQEVKQEMQNATDGEDWSPFLRALEPTQSSPAENEDHTYFKRLLDSAPPRCFTISRPAPFHIEGFICTGNKLWT